METDDRLTDASTSEPGKCRKVHSPVGKIEAYLGALAMAVYFGVPLAIPLRHVPLSVRTAVGITLLGLGILLSSLWGIRFGRGVARVVAWVAIIVLSEQAFAVVLTSLVGGSF